MPGGPDALEFGGVQLGDFGVVDDDDVFVVALVSVVGKVERAGDDDALVDHDHLMMQESRVAIRPHQGFAAVERRHLTVDTVGAGRFKDAAHIHAVF